MRAVLASRNKHKAQQVALLLDDVELVPLDDVAPDLVLEEPFDTFADNALAKARAVVEATGIPAIADDSGIEVDALDGAPGVHSARYAGESATDDDNNRKLVAALRDVPEQHRTCRYRCVAAAVFPDGREVVAEGSCEGRVVLEGRGTLGFGYDPHVVPEGEARTMGEIPLEEKIGISHRGRAFRALGQRLKVAAVSDEAAALRVARDAGTLDEADVSGDPVKQFARWMEDALASEPGEPNAMSLATSTREGRPSVRMVLLRGFDGRGFTFYTSYLSRKGRELDENPQAALVFYWGTLQRQVCITGIVERLPEEDSNRYFAARPRGHQIGAWASEQSRVISGRAELEERARRVEGEFLDAEVTRPPHWGGFRLVPETVEFWQGRVDRLHDRVRYTRSDTGWTIERLAP